MKKDTTRDYAIAAFARYFAMGCPGEGQIEERTRNRIERENAGATAEDIASLMECELIKLRPTIKDIDAVREVLSELESGTVPEIAKAVRAVYSRPAKHKNEIEFRVIAFAIDTPADKRTVYRWLKIARTMFATARGLVVE